MPHFSLEGRGVCPHKQTTKGYSLDLGLHFDFQDIPSAEMRNQCKGPVSTKDQCSRSRVPHHLSNPRGHTCHRSNTRRHPKGRPTTTTYNWGGNFFSSFHHKGRRRKRRRVEVSNFEDEFNVFNQILSSKALPGDLSSASSAQFNFHQEEVNTSDEMGIQRKQRSTLQELLESQPRGHAPRKTPQTRLPTPLPIQPLRADLADHKRKREEKWNDVVETMKTQPSQEIES